MKTLIAVACLVIMVSCSRYRAASSNPLPSCLAHMIDSLANIYEKPLSVTRYDLEGKTVYYMKAACCDRFNVVFDTDCKVLGYPDGGYTGRGDGSMPEFRDSAQNPVVVWRAGED